MTRPGRKILSASGNRTQACRSQSEHLYRKANEAVLMVIMVPMIRMSDNITTVRRTMSGVTKTASKAISATEVMVTIVAMKRMSDNTTTVRSLFVGWLLNVPATG